MVINNLGDNIMRFIQLPIYITIDSRLTIGHLNVLMALSTYSNAKHDGWCFPYYKTICNFVSLSRDRVIKIMNDLVDWDYVFKETRALKHGGSTSNRYKLNMNMDIIPTEFIRPKIDDVPFLQNLRKDEEDLEEYSAEEGYNDGSSISQYRSVDKVDKKVGGVGPDSTGSIEYRATPINNYTNLTRETSSSSLPSSSDSKKNDEDDDFFKIVLERVEELDFPHCLKKETCSLKEVSSADFDKIASSYVAWVNLQKQEGKTITAPGKLFLRFVDNHLKSLQIAKVNSAPPPASIDLDKFISGFDDKIQLVLTQCRKKYGVSCFVSWFTIVKWEINAGILKICCPTKFVYNWFLTYFERDLKSISQATHLAVSIIK